MSTECSVITASTDTVDRATTSIGYMNMTALNSLNWIELFKTFKGLSRVRDDEMFTLDGNKKGTRSHCLELHKTRHTRDITDISFQQGSEQMELVGSADIWRTWPEFV